MTKQPLQQRLHTSGGLSCSLLQIREKQLVCEQESAELQSERLHMATQLSLDHLEMSFCRAGQLSACTAVVAASAGPAAEASQARNQDQTAAGATDCSACTALQMLHWLALQQQQARQQTWTRQQHGLPGQRPARVIAEYHKSAAESGTCLSGCRTCHAQARGCHHLVCRLHLHAIVGQRMHSPIS